MKRIFVACVILLMVMANACSADVYTCRISNLDAVKFIQNYNAATYKEHGKINYFVTPEINTPDGWKGFWPYDLWKTVSIDSKYRLEITVDKKGYVSKVEINCAYESYRDDAVKMMIRMLSTSSYLSSEQINYLIRMMKVHKVKNKTYYSSEMVVNNRTTVVFYTNGEGNVVVFGRSPYD